MLEELKPIQTILPKATNLLTPISTTAALDASLLLAFVLGITRTELYALDPHYLLTPKQCSTYKNLLNKRLSGYPVAYLLGYREFYGRNFAVEKGVLIPRPDSEILIEKVLDLSTKQPITTIRDIGTGSGALAITLFKELQPKTPNLKVSASDISACVAKIFALNNQTLANNGVTFLKTSLLDDGHAYDLIVANLPYLTSAETKVRIEGEQWQEPALALDGGADGLDFIKKLIVQAQNSTKILILEADPKQMPAIARLLEAHGFVNIEVDQDLYGDDRIITGYHL